MPVGKDQFARMEPGAESHSSAFPPYGLVSQWSKARAKMQAMKLRAGGNSRASRPISLRKKPPGWHLDSRTPAKCLKANTWRLAVATLTSVHSGPPSSWLKKPRLREGVTPQESHPVPNSGTTSKTKTARMPENAQAW